VVDSTGAKIRRSRAWMERKHVKKKQYVKLHFTVDAITKEVVAIDVSTDDVHEVKLSGALKKAEERSR